MAADEKRIRIAYERGRLVRAALGALPVAAVALAALLVSPNKESTCGFGAALVLVAGLFLWRGQALGRSVVPGLLVGLVPAGAALLASRAGHFCTADACYSLCIPACVGSALVAGLWLTRIAKAGGHPRRGVAGGVGIALLTGGLGCACVGAGGLLGMLVGLVLTTAPTFVRAAPAR